CQQESYWSTF
nr:immunoglobulin light chain junction region [Macaca mulatta]